jgi:hypothetical protein
MKKIIIILAAAAVVAVGCGNRQPTVANETFIEENVAQEDSIIHDVLPDSDKTEAVSHHHNGSNMFDIQKIDEKRYFSLKEDAGIQTIELEKLIDLEQIKKMLKGQVIWGKYDYEKQKMLENEQGENVFKIVFRNGKTISYDYPEVGFVAYYPQEDILLLEGEHSSSMIFNLTTGEETEDVGDPEFRRYSPSKQYRFNGYYSGQADVYFIQEKSEERYKTIIELDYSSGSELEKLIGFIPEWLPDMFWQNDTILNFVAPRYFYPEDKTEKFYYQLILKRK